MKFRNTAIAALILAALGSWIYFYEYKGEEARQKAEENSKKVVVFDADKALSLTLTMEKGEIALAKSDGVWRIEKPFTARADSDEVSGLLSTLSLLDITGHLGTPDGGLAQFKLDQPPLTVKLDPGEGKPEIELSVGDKTPVGGEYYARIGASPEVVTLSSSVGKLLDTDAGSLRYKRIVGADSWDISGFSIEKDGHSVGFTKHESDWRFDKPIEFPADRGKVSSLLYDLTALRAEGFDPPGTDPSKVGLDPAAAALTIRAKGEPVVVRFGQPDAEGMVHVQRSDMPEIFTLKKDVLGKLAVPVDEFRDGRIAPVDKWAISRIKAATPEGEKILVKDPEANWRWGSIDGPTLQASDVEPLLDAIEAARASGYEDAPGAGAKIAGPPPLTLELKAGKGKPLEIKMGGEAGGKIVFASTASSSLYEVDKAAADKLVDVARALKAPVSASTAAAGTKAEGEGSR